MTGVQEKTVYTRFSSPTLFYQPSERIKRISPVETTTPSSRSQCGQRNVESVKERYLFPIKRIEGLKSSQCQNSLCKGVFSHSVKISQRLFNANSPVHQKENGILLSPKLQITVNVRCCSKLLIGIQLQVIRWRYNMP